MKINEEHVRVLEGLLVSLWGDEYAALTAAIAAMKGPDAAQLRRERDYLVKEYERAVGCGPQSYLHAAMHLFNAITNAQVDAKVAALESKDAEIARLREALNLCAVCAALEAK